MDIADLGIKITTDGAGKATVALDSVAKAAERAEDAAQDLTAASGQMNAAMGKMGRASILAGNNTRMLTMQLSQVAQQASATGNVVQALSIQAADIGMVFGTVGTVVGVLATVALPSLVNMLTGVAAQSDEAAAAAERLSQAYEALGEATLSAQTQIDKLRFGVDEEYQVELLREQIRLQGEYNAKVGELQVYQATTTDSLDRQKITIEGMVADIGRIAAAYNSNAQALADQADRAATLAVMEGVRAQRAGEAAARQKEAAAEAERLNRALATAHTSYANLRIEGEKLAKEAADAKSTAERLSAINYPNISTAANEAARLATNMDAAAGAAARLASFGASQLGDQYRMYGQGRVAGERLIRLNSPAYGGDGNVLPDSYYGSGSGGGSGGGGGATGTPGVESLIQELQTEREILEAWYAESLLILEAANEAELAAIGGRNEAKLRMEQEYQDRMRGIVAAERSARMGEYADMFEGLASIAAAGGNKMLKVQATLSAAATLIAGYETAMKAAAEATTIPGRIAAYAKFLGMGLSAVAQIRKAGGVGGGAVGSSSVSAPSTQQSRPQDVILDFSTTMDPVMRALAQALAGPMIEQFQKHSKTGVNVVGVRY